MNDYDLFLSTIYSFLNILFAFLFYSIGRNNPRLKVGYTYKNKNNKTIVFIWNSGRGPLKKVDIIYPIRFEFSKSVALFKPRIIKQTKSRYHGKIASIKKYSAKQFSIDFLFLNPDEGFVIEVQHAKKIPRKVNLVCKSVIIGNTKHIKPRYIVFNTVSIMNIFGIILFLFFYLTSFGITGLLFLRLGIKLLDNVLASTASFLSSLFFFEILLVFFIWYFNSILIPASIRKIED